MPFARPTRWQASQARQELTRPTHWARRWSSALHRFTDVNRAPDEVSVAVLGSAITTLDAMLAEVLRLQMPLDVPGLIEQLQTLHPQYDDETPAGSCSAAGK